MALLRAMMAIWLSPEEAGPAVSPPICLHAFKAAHAVVQDLSCWVYTECSEGHQLWHSPALASDVLHDEHVVGEVDTKLQGLQGWKLSSAMVPVYP